MEIERGSRLEASQSSPTRPELRDAIADRPSLLFDGDERPVAVATEVPVPSTGSADVVAVNAAGRIMIVERKLKKNPEIRRRVIGQVFAYAGWFWQSPYEEFEKRIAKGARNSESWSMTSRAGRRFVTPSPRTSKPAVFS